MVQVKVGAAQTNRMDFDTISRVRGFQRANELPVTGIVDHRTATVLGENASYGLVPVWFTPPLLAEDALRELLHLEATARLEDGVRRFQSSRGLEPTGVIDQALAIELGD